MEREKKIITHIGTYKFGNNYELIFKNDKDFYLDYCNIICGDNCNIVFANRCNITCGNNCRIDCGIECNITCGNNCLIDCDITCENNCKIVCTTDCDITCENNCSIDCGHYCIITCGNNCQINCGWFSFIKGGEGSQLKVYGDFFKTISKSEKFIWWYYDYEIIPMLINTYENVDWKNENVDKWNEFYAFVHNELDSATLF